jgi:hypothetical protein
LFVNAGSLATSSEYVVVPGDVRTAFVIETVTGCCLNLYDDPFAGPADSGAVKLALGLPGEFEHAAPIKPTAAAITELNNNLFFFIA